MRLHLENTLDVEAVERKFAELWSQTGGDVHGASAPAILRARVSNLLVFVGNQKWLDEAEGAVPEVAAKHPSRVLLMLGDRRAEDRDIELDVATHCQVDNSTNERRLSCEQATLKAFGRFVSELPSAALPLLVSDLLTFLWWRAKTNSSDDVFNNLLASSDRLIIDSADFEDARELAEVEKLFGLQQCEGIGISDLNWARLTYWRELLADFYDVPSYREALSQIDHVSINYAPAKSDAPTVAAQALLLTGWLASRLDWTYVAGEAKPEGFQSFVFSDRNQRRINVELKSVDTTTRTPGRLVSVELRSASEPPVVCRVARSDDNLHLVTSAEAGGDVQRGRVLPVRNRSAAALLGREMEILVNDEMYQAAVASAAVLFQATPQS